MPLGDKPSRAPIVGRASELSQMRLVWEGARHGNGHVFLVAGEPGIGKSRLASEFIRSVDDDTSIISRLHCAESAVNSELQLVRHFLAKTEGQIAGDVIRWRGKIREAQQSAIELPSVLQRHDALLRALTEIVREITLALPLVIVVEDAHWLDPTSAELLERLIELCPKLRLLIVVTACRPFNPSWAHWSQVSVLLPRRLNALDSAAMAQAVAGTNPLSASELAYVVSRSEGVPLFIEHLAQERACEIVAQNASESLTHLLSSRLDKLGVLRRPAQILAALGFTFSHHHAMFALRMNDNEATAAISGLMEADVLRMQPAKPGGQYHFRHALLHEAAYMSAPSSERAAIHAQVLDALSSPGVDLPQPEILAYHCDRAEMHLEAAKHWLAAGRSSADHGAIEEAINCLTLGLQAVNRSPIGDARDRLEFELNSQLGPALMARHTYSSDEALTAFTRAQSLMRQSRTSLEELHVLLGRFNFHFGRGELSQALDVAKIADHSLSKGYGGYPVLMGQVHCVMGEFVEAKDCLQRALARYNPSIDANSGLFCRADVVATSFLAKVEFALGDVDRCGQLTQVAMDLAHEQGHPVALAIAYLGLLFLEIEFGHFEKAEAIADEALVHASQHRLDNYTHWIAFHRAALTLRTDAANALPRMHRAVDEAEKASSRLFRPSQLGLLGVAYVSIGRPERAVALLDEGLEIARRSGEMEAAPALYRLKARSITSLNRDEALRNLKASLALARVQSSWIEELRTATAIARLLKGSAEQHEASRALAHVCGRFVGQKQFPDLLHAKRVLAFLVSDG